MRKIILIIFVTIVIAILLYIILLNINSQWTPFSVGEGSTISLNSEDSILLKYKCKFGLRPISATDYISGICVHPACFCYVCTKCGDGVCGIGENICNCKEDCKERKSIEVKDKIEILTVDDCFKLNNEQDKEKIFNPVAFSGDPDELAKLDEIDKAPKSDFCIFDFVDKHDDVMDKEVCDKIVTSYFKNLCLQRIAIHLKDPSNCTESFLHDHSNIVGCIGSIAWTLDDKSICNFLDNQYQREDCLNRLNKKEQNKD